MTCPLLIDFGEPLAGEQTMHEAGIEYVFEVAASNGFDLADSIASARLWVGEKYDRESFSAAAAGEKDRRTLSWRLSADG